MSLRSPLEKVLRLQRTQSVQEALRVPKLQEEILLELAGKSTG